MPGQGATQAVGPSGASMQNGLKSLVFHGLPLQTNGDGPAPIGMPRRWKRAAAPLLGIKPASHTTGRRGRGTEQQPSDCHQDARWQTAIL